MQTEITQPAVLTVDIALTRLLAAYGIAPDMVMGHSLGEYGALVAAGVLPFAAALEAVERPRARDGATSTSTTTGAMAAVIGAARGGRADPRRGRRLRRHRQRQLARSQVVIGGATAAVERAMDAAQPSAATRRVRAAGEPRLPHRDRRAGERAAARDAARGSRCRPPELPVVANVDGELLPDGPGRRGARSSTSSAARSPRRCSSSRACRRSTTRAPASSSRSGRSGRCRASSTTCSATTTSRRCFTNHPKVGDIAVVQPGAVRPLRRRPRRSDRRRASRRGRAARRTAAAPAPPPAGHAAGRRAARGRLPRARPPVRRLPRAGPRRCSGGERRAAHDGEPVVITGAALGLPGHRARLRRRQRRAHPARRAVHRRDPAARSASAMLDKHITRLVKSDDGGGRFETIDDAADVIKLAARARRASTSPRSSASTPSASPALGRDTQLAIAAGIDALRDAGIPLVHALQDDHDAARSCPTAGCCPTRCATTPASSSPPPSPASSEFADELEPLLRRPRPRASSSTLLEACALALDGDAARRAAEIDRRIHDLRHELEQQPVRSSTAASCSASCRWATRSSPS